MLSVTFLRSPLPRDKPDLPYPRISERRHQTCRYSLFQGASSHRICTSRYKKMYIKDNDKANSWHKWTLTHRKEFGVGRYLVPDEGMCRLWPEPTQYSIRIFPEVHILPNLLGMTKVRLSATFQRSCPDTSSAKYQECSTTWPTEHLDNVSLLLLDKSFTLWHQTSLFYSQKSLTVWKVTKRIQHRSKTQNWAFWKVTVSMIPWLLNWIIYWIESPQLFLNWIIVWIEFWETNIESNIELNPILPKFKLWIESFWVSIMASPKAYHNMK